MAKGGLKQIKKLNDNRDLAEKEKDVMAPFLYISDSFQAKEKFEQAEAIYRSKEKRQPADLERAKQLYSEAITLLYVLAHFFSLMNIFFKVRTLVNQKRHLQDIMQLEVTFLLLLVNIQEQFSTFRWQTNTMRMMLTIMRREELATSNSTKSMKH